MRDRSHGADDAGLTLVELLIVMVVLGVLSAVVVMAVSRFNGRGKEQACKTDYRTLETAQHARFADVRSYASDVAQLRTEGYLKEEPDAVHGITTDDTGSVYVDGTAGWSSCG